MKVSKALSVYKGWCFLPDVDRELRDTGPVDALFQRRA